MNQEIKKDGVRDRLIYAGLSELCEHGVADFSLRRVASLAEVSCAAPYRHFKDKDELILAIIEHVREGWELLAEQVVAVYGQDPAVCISELCVAMARFWIGNGGFRSLLVMALNDSDSSRIDALYGFEGPINRVLSELVTKESLTETQSSNLSFNVLSMLYGSLMMVGFRAEKRDQILASLRAQVLKEVREVSKK